MLTGFHGLHVTIGAIMLTVIWFRVMKGHFTPRGISRSRRSRGTGTSSTWYGSACSASSTGYEGVAPGAVALARRVAAPGNQRPACGVIQPL